MTDGTWYKRSKTDPQFFEPTSPPVPLNDYDDEQRAFMRKMRGRFIPLAWFALAMNIGLTVQRFIERQWFGFGAALAITGVVILSLRIFYRFKIWR